jgi:hypothetical protein
MAGTELSTEVHHDAHHHHEDGPVVSRDINQRNALSVAFAFVAGTGVILLILVGAIGVIQGSAADSDVMGLLFVAGIALLVVGGLTWAGIVRPWEEFPSVTEGFYETAVVASSHHDDDHAEDAHATDAHAAAHGH